jgi:hypothetical protein
MSVETTKGVPEEAFKSQLPRKSSPTTPNRPPKTQGYSVEEEVNEEDGSIRLVVR